MPIAATALVPRQIPFPALPEDPLTQQHCRLLWEQIGQLQATVAAHESTIANLLAAVNILETNLVALKDACAGSGIFTGTGNGVLLE